MNDKEFLPVCDWRKKRYNISDLMLLSSSSSSEDDQDFREQLEKIWFVSEFNQHN